MSTIMGSARFFRRLAVIGSLAYVAACGPREPVEEVESDDEPGMGEMGEGMEGMPGMGAGGMVGMMGGGMMGGDMMARMREHMDRMVDAHPDSVGGMLATHRQMVGNMLAQMNREMDEMAMATDAAWDATVDSLRSDLTRMPRMDAAELRALMPAHRRRVLRLMEMHGTMMRGR